MMTLSRLQIVVQVVVERDGTPQKAQMALVARPRVTMGPYASVRDRSHHVPADICSAPVTQPCIEIETSRAASSEDEAYPKLQIRHQYPPLVQAILCSDLAPKILSAAGWTAVVAACMDRKN